MGSAAGQEVGAQGRRGGHAGGLSVAEQHRGGASRTSTAVEGGAAPGWCAGSATSDGSWRLPGRPRSSGKAGSLVGRLLPLVGLGELHPFCPGR